MSTYWGTRRTEVLAADAGPGNIDSAAAAYEFVPGHPVAVIRMGIVATTAIANAAGTVTVTATHRPTAGSATGAVLKDTMQVTGTTTVAAGAGVYRDLDIPAAATTPITSPITHTVNTGPDGPIVVNPGESLIFDVGNAADSGSGYFFFEFVELPFAGTAIANMTEDTT